jgi:hypothetical protein
MPCNENGPQRAGSLQAITRLPEPEFTGLLPYVTLALATSLSEHTTDRQPCTSRRDRTSDRSP